MSYSLKFFPSALKEWKKLDRPLQAQFKKKLAERLKKPRIISAKLSGFEDHYKIKLKASGYRLVYEVVDAELLVSVVAVGKRERNVVYKKAKNR